MRSKYTAKEKISDMVYHLREASKVSTPTMLSQAIVRLRRLIMLCSKSRVTPTPLWCLSREKSRLAHLLGCKRPRGGLLPIPIFASWGV